MPRSEIGLHALFRRRRASSVPDALLAPSALRRLCGVPCRQSCRPHQRASPVARWTSAGRSVQLLCCCGMSQKDLAAAAGVDVRQIRSYEAGEQQPLLSVAVAIADALRISVTEQPGKPSHRIRLSGQWWASWQTSRSGDEKSPPSKWRLSRKATCSRSPPSLILGVTGRVRGRGRCWRGSRRGIG
jgi:DNA-binding XRE family transcriptional regulator